MHDEIKRKKTKKPTKKNKIIIINLELNELRKYMDLKSTTH